MAQILDAKKELNVKCNKNSAEPVSAPVLYQTLFGCLIYLTTTRSDIYYVVQVVNQIMSNPWHLHGSAVLRGIRYLQGTPRCGIFFARDSSVQFTTYANVDWVRCLDTCQSGTSWYIFLENSLIRWKCKKHGSTFESSTESEYRSMSSKCSEIIWFQYLLKKKKNLMFLSGKKKKGKKKETNFMFLSQYLLPSMPPLYWL